MNALDSIFKDIFSEEIQKPRASVYILIGKLGLHHGKQKILGVYPSAELAENRKRECEKNLDTLFRKYLVAQVSVTEDGANCNMEF